jgi:hypothetical protein
MDKKNKEKKVSEEEIFNNVMFQICKIFNTDLDSTHLLRDWWEEQFLKTPNYWWKVLIKANKFYWDNRLKIHA